MSVYGPDHETQADQQAEADWVHSPEWTAYHDHIDGLQLGAQHEEALADNQAQDREAGS